MSRIKSTFLLLAFAVAMISIAVPTYSQRRKPAQKSGRTVGDLLKEIRARKVKTSTALPQTQYEKRRKKVNLRAIKPPRSNRFLKGREGDEGKLEDILDQEIAELYKLTQKYDKSPNRGEIWLRLAERYVEKAKFVEFRAQKVFDETILKWENRGRKGRRPRLNLSDAKTYNKKAIQLYQWFLRDFPRDSKVDQALFFLGYNFFELGDSKRGEKYYKTLTSKYKRSPYVDESNFALGEFYFENDKWGEARNYYLKVARKRGVRLYGFALYKLAWCEYRLGRPKKAVKLFEAVVRDSKTQSRVQGLEGRKEVNKIRLGREALRDLVPIYSETGRYEKARGYFAGLSGSNDVSPLIERLAFIYADAGKRVASRYLFKSLIAENPTNPKAFEYQSEVVSVYRAGGQRAIFKAELFEWISGYSRDSDWGRANKEDKDLLESADAKREKTLRNYVLEAHKVAQDSKARTAQKEALDGYRLYLSSFGKSEKVADMHFFFGELLFDLGKYEEASVHYMWVADNAPKNQYHQKSVLNMLLALEKRLPSEEKLVQRMRDSLDKVKYSKAEARFMNAANRYLSDYKSKGQKSVDVEFKLARLLYAHNEFDKALKHFWHIIEVDANSEYATYSANLILDTYNLKKDYDGLAKAGQKLLKYPKLLQKGTGADIKNIVQRAEFKKAQDAEAAKDYLGSAKEYESFIKSNPNSNLVSTAMFNAGVNYERAGKLLPAIGIYTQLLGRNDKAAASSKQRARRLRARLYEQTGQLERAAIEFERYAKENPKDSLADESWSNAAAIWFGLKRWDRATRAYNTYNKKSRSSEKVNALYKLGELNEKRRRTKSAYSYYERFIKSNPQDANLAIAAHLNLGRLSEKLKWRNRAKEWYTKTVAVRKAYERKGIEVGRSEAAESEFYLLQDTYREFRAIRIPKQESKQAAAIQKKLGLLKQLSGKLEKVIAYDDANYVVASVGLLGEANEHFVNTVMTAPVPKGLTKEQVKQYREAVDKQIASIPRENAIKNYDLAIRRSVELNAYNEWVNKSHEGMSRLKPKDHKALKEETSDMTELDYMEIDKSKSYSAFFKAITSGNEAATVDQGSKLLAENPKDGRVLNGLAVFYLKTGRPDLARIYLGKALDSESDKSSIHNNLGVALHRDGETNLAVQEYFKSVAIDDDNPTSSANLGSILVKYQNFKQAEVYLDNAEDKYDKNLDFLNNFAVTHRYLGNKSKAKRNYEKALKIKSSDASTQLNYARLLAEEYEDKKEAIKVLNKVKFLGGNTKVVREANEMLKQLQK